MSNEIDVAKKLTPAEIKEILQEDSKKIFEYTNDFLSAAYPSYKVDKQYAMSHIEKNSKDLLENMSFFRVASCTIENTDDISLFFRKKMEKLLAAAYASGSNVCFGFIGRQDQITLVLGIDPCQARANSQSVKDIAQGILPGVILEQYRIQSSVTPSWWGMMEAIPTTKIEDEEQKIDYTGLLRSLNGREFNFFIIARPIPPQIIQTKIGSLLAIQTKCSEMLKRNFAIQSGETDTAGSTKTVTDTSTIGGSVNGAPIGAIIGGYIGAHAGGVGALPGILAGAAIGAGFSVNTSKSHAESLAENISKAVSSSFTESFDVQNHFAKELMDYTEDALTRLKLALVTGGWDTCITYSAKDAATLELLQGYVFSDIAKPDKHKLPARIQAISLETLLSNWGCDDKRSENYELLIPKGFFNLEYIENNISAPLNSSELGMLFAFPETSAPGFELREGKFYSFSAENAMDEQCRIGNVCDGEHVILNSSFSLSHDDLNKHTFICGITGCGKTNSVKKILLESHVPFLVLECAKKEYRNINVSNENLTVFTLGHPEIHSPQFNPFYIQPGITLQTHIDYLKDLFNASFSFYGPMTYILETCLYRIYKNKGWNLTTGDHPSLVNSKSIMDRYDPDFISKQYEISEHRFLFPTMNDLLHEVKIYIEKELNYDSEVSGNIKSAMIARLEGLSMGAKGYMFNTYAPANMRDMLEKNVILELEGFSDDSDKAFVVGLLIIFIKEYRQCQSTSPNGLQHILVIEEAHRLLKNVATERTSETMGNPKGKAVEHFANMLAEMRSYGQGVIIAEQIPSKIAPDVIKNSSNKIIHRLVSKDDQEFMANTIGVREEHAIYFGAQKPGFALCHKEGMYTPVSVKIDKVENKVYSDLDIREKAIANANVTHAILCHQIRGMSIIDDLYVFRLLNSLLNLSIKQRETNGANEYEDAIKYLCDSIRKTTEKIRKQCMREKLAGTPGDINKAISSVLAEKITALLCSAQYNTGNLPKEAEKVFAETFESPSGIALSGKTFVSELLSVLANFDKYGNLLYDVITSLAIKLYFEKKEKQAEQGMERRKLIASYFLFDDDTCITQISRRICQKYTNVEVM